MVDSILLFKVLSGIAWLVPAAMAVTPTWRIFRRRARHHDAIWAVTLLGIINRWTFTTGWPGRDLSYIMAFALALILAAVMYSYQAEDR